MGELLGGLAGLAGSLILGKLKKSAVPFKWGPGNNLIPVTNPIATGIAAWETTSDVGITSASVGGSLAAWGVHRLLKKYLVKK